MANIDIGKPEVDPTLPSHVSGVRQGNWPNLFRSSRHKDEADIELGARRSTGIASEIHSPIDPRMPKLSPA